MSLFEIVIIYGIVFGFMLQHFGNIAAITGFMFHHNVVVKATFWPIYLVYCLVASVVAIIKYLIKGE